MPDDFLNLFKPYSGGHLYGVTHLYWGLGGAHIYVWIHMHTCIGAFVCAYIRIWVETPLTPVPQLLQKDQMTVKSKHR